MTAPTWPDHDGPEPHRPYPCPACGGNGCPICGGRGELLDTSHHDEDGDAEQEAIDAVTCTHCQLVVDEPDDLTFGLCARCDLITDHVGFVPRRRGWL